MTDQGGAGFSGASRRGRLGAETDLVMYRDGGDKDNIVLDGTSGDEDITMLDRTSSDDEDNSVMNGISNGRRCGRESGWEALPQPFLLFQLH